MSLDILELQAIENPQSHVQTFIAKNKEALKQKAIAAESDPFLLKLQQLFETVYGYRESVNRGRLTRGVGSAGGMFPIDVSLITSEQQLSYNFEKHQFEPMSSNSLSSLTDESHYLVILHADLSRTLKRYGIRGYRYILIDAGQVLEAFANIFDTPLHCLGSETIKQCQLTFDAPIHVIKLPISELTALSHLPELTQAPISKKVLVTPHPHDGKNLQCAKQFHKEALSTSDFPGFTVKAIHQKKPEAERVKALTDRFSSSSFTDQACSRKTVKNLLSSVDSIPGLETYLVANHIKGLKPGLYQVQDSELHSLKPIKNQVIQTTLFEHCESQQLMKEGAFTLIFAANSEQLKQPNLYFFLVSRLGLMDAQFYDACTDLGLGSSCIGGFSDSEIKKAFGLKAHPLMCHVFGFDDPKLEKLDAMYTETDYEVTHA